MKIKAADYIAEKLSRMGIEQVFSVTGGGAMHLNNAFGHHEKLKCLYQHHEQACAMAAESYARIHNKMALLCVTTGPGGTNAITGVVGGWLDSIPMFVVSGQVRYDTTARWSGVGIRSMGDQEFDICRAISCMTKYCEMVTDPMRLRFCLEKAFFLAANGRPGPVWLDIPLNVQAAMIETDDLTGFDADDYLSGGTGWADREGLLKHGAREDLAGQGEKREKMAPLSTRETARAIIEKIKSSRRPVFMAGNGIRIAGAFEEFRKVAKYLGIPVVLGWNSQDLCETEYPLYTGRSGNMGDRPGNFAVQNSDLVFAVGNRLSIRIVGFNYKTWAREAFVIVNDIDAEELKKPSVHTDMPVHADAKDLLKTMCSVLEEEYAGCLPVFDGGEGLKGKTWLETCAMWKEKYPVVQPKHLANDDTKRANVYALCDILSRALPKGQNIVMGNGSACVAGGHSFYIKTGQRFISNDVAASMGYDLPAAIGVYMADRDNPHGVVLLTGDGSIQMNIQELQTIIHHRMPIKIFLINNDGYHSIRQTQKNFFGEPLVGIGPDSGDLSFPDMKKLAWAYGIQYVSAATNSELGRAVEETLHMDGPVICEVFVTTDQNFEPKSSGKRLADGTMVSPPLEDLSPFLSEEEMDAMMIIERIRDR